MANLVTIARFPLLIAIILMLYSPSPELRVLSAALLLLLIGMDSLDGMLARARDEESLLGSVLDIMADRSVEMVMWVVYAHLRLVAVAIPIVFIIRGVVTDALRAVHVGEGQTPFGAMQSPVGKWIVASPWMRSSYAIVKMLAFTGLALTHGLLAYAERGVLAPDIAETSWLIFRVMAWIATVFCIVRGLPVVIESVSWLRSKEDSA